MYSIKRQVVNGQKLRDLFCNCMSHVPSPRSWCCRRGCFDATQIAHEEVKKAGDLHCNYVFEIVANSITGNLKTTLGKSYLGAVFDVVQAMPEPLEHWQTGVRMTIGTMASTCSGKVNPSALAWMKLPEQFHRFVDFESVMATIGHLASQNL